MPPTLFRGSDHPRRAVTRPGRRALRSRRALAVAAYSAEARVGSGRRGRRRRRPTARARPVRATAANRDEGIGIGFDAVSQAGETLPLRRDRSSTEGIAGREERHVDARRTDCPGTPRLAAARPRGGRPRSRRSSPGSPRTCMHTVMWRLSSALAGGTGCDAASDAGSTSGRARSTDRCRGHAGSRRRRRRSPRAARLTGG